MSANQFQTAGGKVRREKKKRVVEVRVSSERIWIAGTKHSETKGMLTFGISTEAG